MNDFGAMNPMPLIRNEAGEAFMFWIKELKMFLIRHGRMGQDLVCIPITKLRDSFKVRTIERNWCLRCENDDAVQIPNGNNGHIVATFIPKRGLVIWHEGKTTEIPLPEESRIRYWTVPNPF